MKKLRMALLALAIASIQLAPADASPGFVVGWGHNVAGEATGVPSYPLSNGIVVITHKPYATGTVALATGIVSNAIAISANSGFSLALRSDGTVVGWGGNQTGHATGIATPYPYRTNGPVILGGQILSNVTAIASGGSSLALKHDGTVVTWGNNQVSSGLSNVVALAGKSYFNLALKEDGSVVSWTSDPIVTSTMPANLSNVVSIACGGRDHEHSMALKNDGSIVVWGAGFPPVKEVPAGATNAVAIAAGVCHNLALKKDGTVFGWGCNTEGQATGVPTNQNPSDPGISSGLVTIKGQVLSNVVSIAAGDVYSMALKGDGTIVMWGDKRFYKDVPAGLTNVTAIATGDGFCLAITTNRAVAARFAHEK